MIENRVLAIIPEGHDRARQFKDWRQCFLVLIIGLAYPAKRFLRKSSRFSAKIDCGNGKNQCATGNQYFRGVSYLHHHGLCCCAGASTAGGCGSMSVTALYVSMPPFATPNMITMKPPHRAATCAQRGSDGFFFRRRCLGTNRSNVSGMKAPPSTNSSGWKCGFGRMLPISGAGSLGFGSSSRIGRRRGSTETPIRTGLPLPASPPSLVTVSSSRRRMDTLRPVQVTRASHTIAEPTAMTTASRTKPQNVPG
jgi:hypothetical protein